MMRRLVAVGALAALGACIGDAWREPVVADEIIQNASIVVENGGAAFADGRTRLVFGFDVPDVSGLDPQLTATLHVAGGTWVLPDSSATATKTVNVTAGHQEYALIAGTVAQPLVATVTIKTFTGTATLELVPLTADDAITTLSTTAVKPPADGTTPIPIHMCTTAELVGDPTAQVTLHTSDGTWIGASASDAKALIASLSTACIDASLIPSQTAGRIEVSATVARFTKTMTIDLAPAELEQVVCSVNSGTSSGAGMISVSARLLAKGGGKPSFGTSVSYSAVITPGTASGFFTQPLAILDAGASTASIFMTFGYPTTLVFTATATPSGGAPVTCPAITVNGAPPPP